MVMVASGAATYMFRNARTRSKNFRDGCNDRKSIAVPRFLRAQNARIFDTAIRQFFEGATKDDVTPLATVCLYVFPRFEKW